VGVNSPLIKLDPTQINIQIKQASDNLVAAKAYLNSVSAGGSTVAVAQAQQQYDLAKSRYDALVAQSSSLTVNRGNLVATMVGVVTEVNVNSGEVFAANAPLLTIMDESTVIVHVKVPLASLGKVHVGQSAEVTPSALPNVNLKGQVRSIIPQADPQTDTFEVWVEVPNPDNKLLPGMSAFVRIQSSGVAVAVPRLAVMNPDRDSSVFVVHNGHAFLEHVHVVGRSVDTVYIDSGLSARDEVVLVGLSKLHNGQRVHVVSVEKGIS
jgi:RND family efflux transporter MFP subunit